MLAMSHPFFNQIFAAFIVRFFFVFGIIGLAVGVGLIVSRAHTYQFFRIMNHWASLRRSGKWLAVPRDIGPVTQRFQRLLGTVFIVIATYSTFVLITQTDINAVVTGLRIEASHFFAVWIVESVYWSLVAGSMVAIAVGILLLFFPSVLRAIETQSNHWYSFRSNSQRADTMHMWFDSLVERYPRAIGGIIAVAALIVVIDYGILLFVR